MNVPIRMLGIATSFFWIILIVFIALGAYSVKDLEFDFGEPEFTTSSDGQLSFSFPLYVNNRGYYSLENFRLSTVLSDVEGVEISKDTTFISIIPHGEKTTILHNVTLSFESLLEKEEQYLFNDNNLDVSVAAGLNFAEVLPAQISTNFTFPVGAPFYNFALDQPSYRRFETAYAAVAVPMSFENHAAFDIVGIVTIELCEGGDSLLGESQTMVCVPQQSVYVGYAEFHVPFNAASSSTAQNWYFKVYFDTGFFEYGSLVIPYG